MRKKADPKVVPSEPPSDGLLPVQHPADLAPYTNAVADSVHAVGNIVAGENPVDGASADQSRAVRLAIAGLLAGGGIGGLAGLIRARKKKKGLGAAAGGLGVGALAGGALAAGAGYGVGSLPPGAVSRAWARITGRGSNKDGGGDGPPPGERKKPEEDKPSWLWQNRNWFGIPGAAGLGGAAAYRARPDQYLSRLPRFRYLADTPTPPTPDPARVRDAAALARAQRAARIASVGSGAGVGGLLATYLLNR